MTALFDFPKAYGKLGSWPGSIGPGPAQQIYLISSQCQPNSKFIEVGFDGGRTTIALNWAASGLNAKIAVVGVSNQWAATWLTRIITLYKAQGRIISEAQPNYGEADLVVINGHVGLDAGLIEAMKPGAFLLKIGATDFHDERLALISQSPDVTIWQRTGVDKVVDAAIDRVVADISEKVVPLDSHRVVEVHSGVKSGKRHRHGDSADPKVHAIVDAGKSPELREDKRLES